MVNQLITIGEAADLVNKSAQTIRRLIKGNKIKFKRKRTPQGFNYVVDKASLLEFFQMLKNTAEEVIEATIQAPVQTTSQQTVVYPSETPIQQPQTANEIYMLEAEDVVVQEQEELPDENQQSPQPFVETPIQTPVSTSQSAEQISDYSVIIEKLLDQHRQDKEKLYQLLEVFQNRIVALEDHIRLLQAPKKKWWEIWK